MANTYDRGQYRGEKGWEKLKYALQLRANLQGMTGAVMDYTITREMIQDSAEVDDVNNLEALNLRHLTMLVHETRRKTIPAHTASFPTLHV